MRGIQSAAFTKLNKTFPEEKTREWEAQVTAWDKDNSKPNPYVEPAQGQSLASLKLELAQEEAADTARGVFRTQDKSMSTFLSNVLDVAEEQ